MMSEDLMKMMRELEAQAVKNRLPGLVRNLTAPSPFRLDVHHTPPRTWRRRLNDRISTARSRVSGAWRVLTGKSDVKEPFDWS